MGSGNREGHEGEPRKSRNVRVVYSSVPVLADWLRQRPGGTPSPREKTWGRPRPGGAGGGGGGALCAAAEEPSRTSRKTPPAFDNSESAGGWKDLSAEQRGSARTEGSRQRLSLRLPEAEAAQAPGAGRTECGTRGPRHQSALKGKAAPRRDPGHVRLREISQSQGDKCRAIPPR